MSIFERTVAKYGAVMQIEVLIEEMAELIKALQKWKRKIAGTPNAEITPFEIIGEAVDVAIMLEQLKLIFPEDARFWDRIHDLKLERMEKRLKEGAKA